MQYTKKQGKNSNGHKPRTNSQRKSSEVDEAAVLRSKARYI